MLQVPRHLVPVPSGYIIWYLVLYDSFRILKIVIWYIPNHHSAEALMTSKQHRLLKTSLITVDATQLKLHSLPWQPHHYWSELQCLLLSCGQKPEMKTMEKTDKHRRNRHSKQHRKHTTSENTRTTSMTSELVSSPTSLCELLILVWLTRNPFCSQKHSDMSTVTMCHGPKYYKQWPGQPGGYREDCLCWTWLFFLWVCDMSFLYFSVTLIKTYLNFCSLVTVTPMHVNRLQMCTATAGNSMTDWPTVSHHVPSAQNHPCNRHISPRALNREKINHTVPWNYSPCLFCYAIIKVWCIHKLRDVKT